MINTTHKTISRRDPKVPATRPMILEKNQGNLTPFGKCGILGMDPYSRFFCKLAGKEDFSIRGVSTLVTDGETCLRTMKKRKIL